MFLALARGIGERDAKELAIEPKKLLVVFDFSLLFVVIDRLDELAVTQRDAASRSWNGTNRALREMRLWRVLVVFAARDEILQFTRGC